MLMFAVNSAAGDSIALVVARLVLSQTSDVRVIDEVTPPLLVLNVEGESLEGGARADFSTPSNDDGESFDG